MYIMFFCLTMKFCNIRELHICKVESRNDSITGRNYIPPNLYERFMHINKVCTERRAEDDTLKTQLRFGRKYIEIYTKQEGDNTGYRFVKMSDFLNVDRVPGFNYNIKWKRYVHRPPRRVINYKNNSPRLLRRPLRPWRPLQ